VKVSLWLLPFVCIRALLFDPHDAHNCQGCHAGRPNWDPFPVWPGAYGSLNDEAFQKHAQPNFELTDLISQKEYGELQNFIGKMSKKESYRHLLPLQLRQPNLKLTQLLSVLNFRRITSSFDGETIKPVIESLLDCDVGQKTPERDRLVAAQLKRDSDSTFIRMSFRQQFAEDGIALGRVTPSEGESDAVYLANLQMLVQNPPIPMRDWSMEVYRRPYFGFRNASGNLLDWLNVIQKQFPGEYESVVSFCPGW